MALRTIVQDGDPILKKVCRPVTSFDDRLATLLDDMRETLLASDGLGLAGPQVGVMRRLFIALDERDLPEDGSIPEGYEPKFIECINPEILEQSEDTVTLYEGCLSFPGRNGAIARPRKVKLRAQDRTGKPFELEAEEMLARCFCHETNHLDGITILDLADHFYEDEHPGEEEE